MTLQEVIKAGLTEWSDQGPERPISMSSAIEHRVTLWMAERDCRLDQIMALAKSGLHPCLRTKVPNIIGDENFKPGWNLQLSPEAGHLIDFSGATLEDVLQEACDKYLPKEATT